MRIAALCLALALPVAAVAETADALLPPPVDPAVEARLVPAVIPAARSAASEGWTPSPMQLAAIVGPGGILRERYQMAETFDDAPLDEDAVLIQAVFDEM